MESANFLGKKIAELAKLAVKNPTPNTKTEAGYCLAFAFQAYADAQGVSRQDLYAKIIDQKNVPQGHKRWAVHAEAGMKALGWEVPKGQAIRAGDMLFSHVPPSYGHIAVFIGLYNFNGVWLPAVAENTMSKKGLNLNRMFPNLRITKLEDWGTPTSRMRPQ